MDYKGKVLLVVNTASKCGFTPQFAGLEELYKQYKDRGLEILGFPCNQFGKQDPGSNDEIMEFCQLNYGVSFPMFGKIEVNGANAHPLYRALKASAPGLLGTEGVKWNFTKFLLDGDGVHDFAEGASRRFASVAHRLLELVVRESTEDPGLLRQILVNALRGQGGQNRGFGYPSFHGAPARI